MKRGFLFGLGSFFIAITGLIGRLKDTSIESHPAHRWAVSFCALDYLVWQSCSVAPPEVFAFID